MEIRATTHKYLLREPNGIFKNISTMLGTYLGIKQMLFPPSLLYLNKFYWNFHMLDY